MTRMFTGGRSSGDGSNTNPIFDRYEKRSAKQTFINKSKGLSDDNLTPEEKYQKNVDKKVAELRAKALSGGSKYKFQLPGTDAGEEKKISKTMEAFIQRAAIKKAKEEQKKLEERAQVKVKAKSYTGMYGGRIDAKGRIYGPGNKLLGSVNMKTGIVKSKAGTRICKYNPTSPYTDHAIVQFIAKECNPNKPTWHGGSAGHGAAMAGGSMGGFYGATPNNSSGMGSFYGNNDNKGGGFWG
jgi:hypothetical protein